jgi:tetratricopeptide (TPR) repeat protein
MILKVRRFAAPGMFAITGAGSARGDVMVLRRIACVLLLAASTAACGDDSQIVDCQRNPNPKRQADACTKVISSNPKSAEAYNNRCFAHNELQQYDRSIPDCDMAIKLDPRNASAFNNRGVAYEMRGEFDQALKDYNKAVALQPKFAVAYANRGDVYSKKGDKDRAVAEYRRALAIEPSNDIAVNGLKRLGLSP